MKGLMMDTPLMIGSIMDHADKNFPDQEIVSVVADQPDFRYTFKDAFQRTRQLGNALKSLDIDVGDRVGTCLLYTSPSPRDQRGSRMPSSA